MTTKTDTQVSHAAQVELAVNKLQVFIDADSKSFFDQSALVAIGAGKEWQVFSTLLLALKPVILSNEAIALLRNKVKLSYAQCLAGEKLESGELVKRVDNMTKDRLAIISNCHKLAAGGKKGDAVIHGSGFAAVEKLVKAHKSGGIKAFKPVISEAVPAELKAAPRASTGASGQTDQVQKGASAAKSSTTAPSTPVIINRVEMLKTLDNLLNTIVKSDIFKPGTDAKLLKMVSDLESLIAMEIEAPAPKQEANAA